MAPTGSGKTAVALIAILQAFARGKRAIYTSPIKALSNQKFSEFTEWFKGRGIDAHVTLKLELIICTSEILRNKLSLIRDGHVNDSDPDLDRLGCVVSDEIHYINDPERGNVWEETIVHMPANVQMVALSATLKDPEKFLQWISLTRKRQGTTASDDGWTHRRFERRSTASCERSRGRPTRRAQRPARATAHWRPRREDGRIFRVLL
ncbi:P-loop containing nucleoside triphosphate hydrolase protein [Pelagophyceae sp. CCMP2097]|nr:P-loop containing nucleoside triphosphate hydrolase protein [Pelagophyceae sp. CCMP2097]